MGIDSELKKVKKPYGWYSAVHQAELFVEGMDKTFDFTGDDMPDQGLFGAEQRPKLIHSVGVVADAKFVPIGSYNYTGLFRGADDCFLRFSLATKPTTKPPVTIPGISLKCMRNGVESGNVYTVLAQREPTSLLDTIGNIVITESPAPSKFGDKDMFFQHTRMEDDVAIRPEWTSDIEAIVAEQQSIPGYAFPDLPFN